MLDAPELPRLLASDSSDSEEARLFFLIVVLAATLGFMTNDTRRLSIDRLTELGDSVANPKLTICYEVKKIRQDGMRVDGHSLQMLQREQHKDCKGPTVELGTLDFSAY